MFFGANPWLFLLFAAPGLWLVWRLYFRSAAALGARPRRVLATLAAAAWIALAWFAVQPFRKLAPDVYHKPAVVLAVDESASYAALGGRAAARAGLDSARRHYESLGFRVRALGFTTGAGLGRALDSLAIPNLQAVLLWSDGRFQGEGEPRGAWDRPAPVFPVKVPMRQEAQGESAVLTLRASGDLPAEAEIEVAWSGTARDAVLELRAAGGTVWTQALERPPGTPPGTRAARAYALPASVAARLAGDAGARPWEWKALVRPRDARANASARNDTLDVQFRGLRRARAVFVRPLRSLEERGLVDALSSDSAEVTAMLPTELKLLPGDVLWARAGARVPARAETTVEYHLPEDRARGAAFGGDARVAWSDSGSAFLPPEVLRLADLGMEGAVLRAPDSGVEALAWAEQDGRRGLLVWRSRLRDARAFGFAPPPLWRTGFQAEAPGAAVRETQGRWVRGVAAWARGPRAFPRGPKRPRDPLAVEMSRLGADEETLARLASGSGGSVLEKNSWPALRGGQARETRFQAAALAPAWPMVLLIASLLCALWALRKRFQID